MPSDEIEAIIKGRVQGVGLRDYAQRHAQELELVGAIRNMPNGTVFLIAQGSEDNLKRFVEYLHEGSVLAEVKEVSVKWFSPLREFDDFNIVYT